MIFVRILFGMQSDPVAPLRWLFVDMNSFFASVEQNDNPALRGKPVGVVPVMTDYTGFIAASIEAKQMGAGAGMSVREARQRFPSLHIIKARPARYIAVHHAILAAADKHAPKEKVYSIDEWSVRLAPAERPPAAAADLAVRIKRQIAVDVGESLKCSAGLAPTRLLAKIACDLQKPDGLTTLPIADLPGRLEHLDLHDLPGISLNMEKRLHQAGVTTIPQLWQQTRQDARRVWGSVMGEHWWCGFHGIDVPEVPTRRSMMGHSNVLEPRFRDEDGAHGILVRLLCKLAMRLRFHGYYAHRLCSWVRHECGRTWVDEIALPCVQDTPSVMTQFEKIWRRRQAMLRHLRRVTAVGPPKKVAVDVLGLVEAADVPRPLFDELDRPLRLSRVMDTINGKFHDAERRPGHAIYPATMHGCHDYAMDDKIAFGRLPDEALAM